MTLGEYRVGLDFNPSGDPDVHAIKRMAAEFIDLCQTMRDKHSIGAETGRLLSLAQTHAEDAAMWAVKAITKKPFTE